MQNWILETVTLKNQRRVAAWTIVVVAALGLMLVQYRYFQNFFSGPYPTTSLELDAIHDQDANPRYFVSVVGQEAIETGVQELSIKSEHGREVSRSVTAEYYALRVGDRFLLFKSHVGAATTAVGALTQIPPDLWRELMSDKEIGAVKDAFYPFYVDGDSFRENGVIGLVSFVVFLCVALWYARPAWGYLREPTTHPVMQRVRSWGNIYTVPRASGRSSLLPHDSKEAPVHLGA